MEMTREQKAQDDLSRSINCFGFDNQKFVEAFASDHRTLQQQFTSMCLAWIEYVGSPDYHFDGRNEYSHQQCEKIRQYMKDNNIYSRMPMI